jgi:hypothetical protein
VTTRWTLDLLPDDVPRANCRGCGTGIALLAGYWADVSGMTVCVKAPLEDTGNGELPDYVFHEPMPAGLRGAPESLDSSQ